MNQPNLATKWVVTIPTTDGLTIHLLTDSLIEAEDTVMELWIALGQVPPPDGADIREVPATWECDGRDNCQVAA